MLSRLLVLSALAAASASAQYSATYTPSATGLPRITEQGQAGTNDCGDGSSQSSQCQNAYINSITDFCLWAPPVRGEVANHEADVVSYCTKSGRGTRVIPEGTIKGVQFVKAPSYVQVAGYGDFTSMNVVAGDAGGELDPHGASGTGNPVGGLVFHCESGSCQQMHEWMSFMSATQFCFRACYDGDRATSLCRHTYDVLGCDFNMPATYPTSYFETCDSDDAQDIAFYDGTYFAQDMTLSGVPVPNAHPAPATSNCAYTSAAALYGTTDFASGVYRGGRSTSTTASSANSTSTSSMSSSSTTSSNSSTLMTSTTSSTTSSTSSSLHTSSTLARPASTSSAAARAQATSTSGASSSVPFAYGVALLSSLSATLFAAVYFL